MRKLGSAWLFAALLAAAGAWMVAQNLPFRANRHDYHQVTGETVWRGTQALKSATVSSCRIAPSTRSTRRS